MSDLPSRSEITTPQVLGDEEVVERAAASNRRWPTWGLQMLNAERAVRAVVAEQGAIPAHELIRHALARGGRGGR